MVELLLNNHMFAQIIVGPDNAFTFDYIFGVDINQHTTASLHSEKTWTNGDDSQRGKVFVPYRDSKLKTSR